jgi:hypothetical protein
MTTDSLRGITYPRTGRRYCLFFALVAMASFGSCRGVSTEPDLIVGYVDHIVATLPTNRYIAVAAFLKSRFGGAWNQQEQKGFLIPGEDRR